ncbi:hypothetical protein NECAME_18181, partial [Necator americanus]
MPLNLKILGSPRRRARGPNASDRPRFRYRNAAMRAFLFEKLQQLHVMADEDEGMEAFDFDERDLEFALNPGRRHYQTKNQATYGG